MNGARDFCGNHQLHAMVRVSGGDLCEAEAPTEPTGETFRQNAMHHL
ncbi:MULTISPECIES: hypothetical protein [Clostridia]